MRKEQLSLYMFYVLFSVVQIACNSSNSSKEISTLSDTDGDVEQYRCILNGYFNLLKNNKIILQDSIILTRKIIDLNDENFLNRMIKFNNKTFDTTIFNYKMTSLIDVKSLDSIKRYYFKSEVKIDQKIIPKVILEIWIFNDTNSRNAVLKRLKAFNDKDWFYISKSKIGFWEKEKNIYFLSSSGSYFDHYIGAFTDSLSTMP